MSRFVPGGTIDQPTERDAAWIKAQQEIEVKTIRLEEESRQEGGKSLYETLQANKGGYNEHLRTKGLQMRLTGWMMFCSCQTGCV